MVGLEFYTSEASKVLTKLLNEAVSDEEIDFIIRKLFDYCIHEYSVLKRTLTIFAKDRLKPKIEAVDAAQEVREGVGGALEQGEAGK